MYSNNGILFIDQYVRILIICLYLLPYKQIGSAKLDNNHIFIKRYIKEKLLFCILMKNEFGIYLRYLRHKYHVTLRCLSDMTGISFSYISNIENGNRKPPMLDKISKIAIALGVTDEEKKQLFDLAISQDGLPEDIVRYMMLNTLSIFAIQIAQQLELDNADWKEIIEFMKKAD